MATTGESHAWHVVVRTPIPQSFFSFNTKLFKPNQQLGLVVKLSHGQKNGSAVENEEGDTKTIVEDSISIESNQEVEQEMVKETSLELLSKKNSSNAKSS
ncbi:hypothetical protein VNO77_19821 [Canavalia gladiata]|uniref:Uncharacterized protein n=1 Tax=Canavalia gladiata TaxID=3824 RepID=A0AAN9QKR9_CANGL